MALKAVVLLVTFLVVVVRAPKADEPSQPFRHATFGEMVRFGFPLTVAGLGLWMVNLSDRLVIGAFMTPADLGLYGAAYTLASMLLLTTAALSPPAHPRFMSAVQAGDQPQLQREVRTFHRYTALTVVPGAIFLAALMHPALLILGGPEFNLDVLVGVLIVAGIFLDQWNGLAHYILAAFDRTPFLENAWLVCGALNIGLNLIAVPAWGLRGAGAVTLISFVVLELLIFREASRHADLRHLYQFTTTMRSALAGGLAGGVALILLELLGEDLIPTAIAAASFWIVYLIAATLVKALRRADFELLLSAVGLERQRLA